MEPNDIRRARLALGLSQAELGRMLGYQGAHIRVQMEDLETGQKPLRGCQERLLRAYMDGYRPSDWPKFTQDSD